MALPPFLARLIGDRSAVAPDLANAQDIGSIGSRFPKGLTTDVVAKNPYRPDVSGADFPEIKLSHPGIPPILKNPVMLPRPPGKDRVLRMKPNFPFHASGPRHGR